MKTVLIDDEPDSVRLLAHQLSKHCPQVSIAATCTSPEDGLAALRTEQPNLVFLDIEMPRMNGFTLLEQLEEMPFHLVFTTAYDRYAVKAFRFNALDYLLKPIDEKELMAAVDKAILRGSLTRQEQFAEAKKCLNHQHKPEKIAVYVRDRFVLLPIQEIIFCESDKSYTTLVLKNGERHLLSKPLGEVEELLSELSFFRIHKQYLVNTLEIAHYSKGEAASLCMSNGKVLPISRYRMEAFKTLFL